MLFSLRYFLFKGFRPFLFKFSLSENITKDNNINASVKKLCDIFVDSAQTTFGTYKNKRKSLNRKPKGDKPSWPAAFSLN
jgi:hypothetical protein